MKRDGTSENVAVSGVHCVPEVEIARDEVRISEAGHLAVLNKDEWNLLVDLIQSAPAGPPPDSPFSCFRR